MSERNASERIDRLNLSVSLAGKLAVLLDPDVIAFLDGHEAGLVTRMTEAAPHDDDTRRDAALELIAWRALRARIASAVSNGPHAAKKLKELTHG